jgi:hypothetical protein
MVVVTTITTAVMCRQCLAVVECQAAVVVAVIKTSKSRIKEFFRSHVVGLEVWLTTPCLHTYTLKYLKELPLRE